MEECYKTPGLCLYSVQWRINHTEVLAYLLQPALSVSLLSKCWGCAFAGGAGVKRGLSMNHRKTDISVPWSPVTSDVIFSFFVLPHFLHLWNEVRWYQRSCQYWNYLIQREKLEDVFIEFILYSWNCILHDRKAYLPILIFWGGRPWMAAAMMTDLGTLCCSPVCHASTDRRSTHSYCWWLLCLWRVGCWVFFFKKFLKVSSLFLFLSGGQRHFHGMISREEKPIDLVWDRPGFVSPHSSWTDVIILWTPVASSVT